MCLLCNLHSQISTQHCTTLQYACRHSLVGFKVQNGFTEPYHHCVNFTSVIEMCFVELTGYVHMPYCCQFRFSQHMSFYTTLMVVGAAVSWDQEATMHTYIVLLAKLLKGSVRISAVSLECASSCRQQLMAVEYICIDITTIQRFNCTLKQKLMTALKCCNDKHSDVIL